MIELKTDWEIVAFDGRIIDRYSHSGASEHYHIDYIQSFKLTTDKKGRQFLRIEMKTPGGFKLKPFTQLSTENVPRAQALVDEVMRVIATR